MLFCNIYSHISLDCYRAGKIKSNIHCTVNGNILGSSFWCIFSSFLIRSLLEKDNKGCRICIFLLRHNCRNFPVDNISWIYKTVWSRAFFHIQEFSLFRSFLYALWSHHCSNHKFVNPNYKTKRNRINVLMLR